MYVQKMINHNTGEIVFNYNPNYNPNEPYNVRTTDNRIVTIYPEYDDVEPLYEYLDDVCERAECENIYVMYTENRQPMIGGLLAVFEYENAVYAYIYGEDHQAIYVPYAHVKKAQKVMVA